MCDGGSVQGEPTFGGMQEVLKYKHFSIALEFNGS